MRPSRSFIAEVSALRPLPLTLVEGVSLDECVGADQHLFFIAGTVEETHGLFGIVAG
jgi:hypothetical protein